VRPTVRGESQGRTWPARLPDGRGIHITEYGEPAGRPLFLFHGTPLSALAYGWFVDGPARARGLRVLCPDRPGIGLSDPDPGRTLLDWADDVSALADAIRVDEFLMLGHSCGGPFALAVAVRLRTRVQAVGLVAAAGPVEDDASRVGLTHADRRFLDLSLRRPRAASTLMWMAALLARAAPSRAFAAMTSELGEADLRVVAKHERELQAAFIESVRQGPRGVVDDYRCWGSPWGFSLREVSAPVHLWQGDADGMIPMSHAERLALELPRAVLHRIPGEGHFSIAHHMGAILDWAIHESHLEQIEPE
jgi:pimeloyl-ACP methyl ester carboxylesterase